ncbi:MAG: hypothetical protein KBB94_00435 [Legionellaceae bacterium]|nr:hypothetical protein [Legionellaceae bacterium]MBP9774378.1 hypothetical protein [Legionellaceae bacterium]
MNIHFSLIMAGGLILLHVLLVVFLLRGVIPIRVSPMLTHIFSALCIFGLLGVTKLFNVKIQFELVFSILLFGVASYFFIFGAVYKSLSLRFLLVTHAYNGQISFKKLNALITHKTFYERVILLQKMGLIVQEKESYKLSEHGACQFKRIITVRKLFGIRTSGLYAQNVKQVSPSCSI